MKLPAPLTVAMQAAFNRYLALDPQAVRHLKPLEGQVVCLRMEGIGIDIFHIFNEDEVEVVEEFSAEPDATIVGGPFSLIAQAIGRRSIFDGDVKIEGDVDTAQKFSRLLTEIDIDWEEHLSRLTGDGVAHQLGRFARGVSSWMGARNDAMSDNTADYLRDETNHVPHSWELDEFIEKVDGLRDRVEVLEARLKARNKNSHANKQS